MKLARLASDVQGVEAEGLGEIGPQTSEHQVGGKDIALDLYSIGC
jgi:hypothetical protein